MSYQFAFMKSENNMFYTILLFAISQLNKGAGEVAGVYNFAREDPSDGPALALINNTRVTGNKLCVILKHVRP